MEQLKPVDYQAIIDAVVAEDSTRSVDQMVGRAMQLSHGKAEPTKFRLAFELIHAVADEINARMLKRLISA